MIEIPMNIEYLCRGDESSGRCIRNFLKTEIPYLAGNSRGGIFFVLWNDYALRYFQKNDEYSILDLKLIVHCKKSGGFHGNENTWQKGF